jgi:hypothetical protein
MQDAKARRRLSRRQRAFPTHGTIRQRRNHKGQKHVLVLILPNITRKKKLFLGIRTTYSATTISNNNIQNHATKILI